MLNRTRKAKKSLLVLTVLCVLFINTVYGVFEQMVNTSIRAQGMAGAFTAISDDAHSWLINPAGLGQVKRGNLGFNYSSIYPNLINDEISQNLVGIAYPLLGKTVFGVTLATLSSEKYKENIYAFSIAREMFTEGLYFGFNYKSLGWDSQPAVYFNKTTEDLGKKNVGYDFGALYTISEELYWGLNLINFNRPDMGTKIEEKLPFKIKTGVNYNYSETMSMAMDVELDSGVSGEGNKPFLAIGVEKWFLKKMFALRFGWQPVIDGGNYTVGASVRLNKNKLGLDMAMIRPIQAEELSIYRFSVLYWLSAKRKVKKVEVSGEEDIAVEDLEETPSAPAVTPAAPSDKRLEEEKPVEIKQSSKAVPAPVTPEIAPSADTSTGPLTLDAAVAQINEITSLIKLAKVEEIKFKPESGEITRGQTTIDKVGDILVRCPELKIKIEAHVAPIGDAGVNLAVSNKQANAVKDYITKKFKVDAKRIRAVGYGDASPLYAADDESAVNMEKNNRVEFSAQ